MKIKMIMILLWIGVSKASVAQTKDEVTIPTLQVIAKTVKNGQAIRLRLTSPKAFLGGFYVKLRIAPFDKTLDRQGLQQLLNSRDERSKDGKLLNMHVDTSLKLILFQGKQDEEQSISIATNGIIAEDNPKDGLPYYVVYEIVPVHGAPVPFSTQFDYALGLVEFPICRECISDEFLNESEQLRIEFVGNGNIQSSFSQGEEIPANTGLGIRLEKLFANRQKKTFSGFYKVNLEGYIGVASTIDNLSTGRATDTEVVSNRSAFGNSILAPLNAGQVVNLNLKLYNRAPLFSIISGYEINFISSNREWQDLGQLYQANSNALRLTAFHDFVSFDQRDRYSALVKLGWAYNSLRADIGLSQYDLLRQEILGTKGKVFRGLTFGLELRLNNIKAEFSYYTLNDSVEGKDVEGLTGARILTTISFTGGFSAILNPKN